MSVTLNQSDFARESGRKGEEEDGQEEVEEDSRRRS